MDSKLIIHTLFVFQRDVCKFLASDSTGAAYTHPLPSKSGSMESKLCHDSNYSAVSSSTPSTLMSSPITCSSSDSTDKVQKIQCRPKRRASQFDEDQENINPAAAFGSIAAANPSAGSDKPGTLCRSPMSKKHCSKETDSTVKRKRGSVDDLLTVKCDGDDVCAENYTALISQMAASSQRHSSSKALNDVTVKFALNRSDDRLHGLIGDFSRPYALPFIENDKHRDLKAISCHTVNSELFCIAL